MLVRFSISLSFVRVSISRGTVILSLPLHRSFSDDGQAQNRDSQGWTGPVLVQHHPPLI